MTNTHINVGGHKITTNKVGQVHSVTSGFSNGFAGIVKWVVTNGICTISAYGIYKAGTGNSIEILANIPKAKITVSNDVVLQSSPFLHGHMYVNEAGTSLMGSPTNGVGEWNTLSYPVADDWVES